MPASPLPPDVAAAIARGQKVVAIQLLRERLGIGLAEAKARVEAHQRGEAQPTTPRRTPGDVLPPAVLEALQRRDMVEAIRRLRAETGLDLKATKEALEKWRARAGPAAGQLAPGEVPRGPGVAGWLIAAAIALLAAGWYFLGW